MPPIQFLPLSAAPQALYCAAVLTHRAALAGWRISHHSQLSRRKLFIASCRGWRLRTTAVVVRRSACVLREGELQARRGAPAAPELSGQVELSDAVLRWTVHAKVLQYRSVHYSALLSESTLKRN
jgi:hypothetical protein